MWGDKMKNITDYVCRALLTLSILVLYETAFMGTAEAQSVALGTELVSRYVWRGTDFGESVSVQPSLSIEVTGLELGTWASYSVSPNGSAANEIDTWIGYAISTRNFGSISFGTTDYYFPSSEGSDFFDVSGNGSGSHMVESFIEYTGPRKLPASFFAAVFVHNDPDNSLYLEASIPVQLDGVEVGFSAGAVAKESTLYQADGFEIVKLGLSATKELALSDTFSLPVTVRYILNAHLEKSYVIAGFKIDL